MARELRDIKALLDKCIVLDDYGVQGSTFACCQICGQESGAGLLWRDPWHAKDCPVPRLERKYLKRGRK